MPELLGWIEPSSSAKVIASPIEASSRNSDSGSRVSEAPRARMRSRRASRAPGCASSQVRFARTPWRRPSHGRCSRRAGVEWARLSSGWARRAWRCAVVAASRRSRPPRSMNGDIGSPARPRNRGWPRSAVGACASLTRRLAKSNGVHKNDTSRAVATPIPAAPLRAVVEQRDRLRSRHSLAPRRAARQPPTSRCEAIARSQKRNTARGFGRASLPRRVGRVA